MQPVLTRQTRIRAARFLLGLFLAWQGVLAFAACEWTERSAARAVASAASSEPCHSGDEELGAGLCIAHCLAGSQNLDKPAAKLPALATAPILVVHSRLEWATPRARDIPLPVAAPPPRILFRTLLI